ncbi:MAG: nucleotidyltransferase family protein [Nitrospirae bacterium]|nr:nucleotidyltransferase family protein [Nitrospirota bacterium]
MELDKWNTAGRQRVQPLIARQIASGILRAGGRLQPTPQAVRRTTLAKNLFILAAEERVTRFMARRHVPCLALKGVGLCELAFPDLGCRPTGDVDLLVYREDVPKAADILRDLGYLPLHPLPELNRFHEATFSHRSNGSRVPPVDLHWGLCAEKFGLHARFDFDLAEYDVWKNADLKGHRLSPEMTFLHIILHAFTNSFSMLSDFVDVMYVFRAVRDRVEWKAWADDVRRFRMAGITAFALSQVARWWEVRYPAPLQAVVQEDLPLAGRLDFLRDAAFRGDIGGWRERLAMPLFFQPAGRVPTAYLRMVFGLLDSRL